MPAGGFLRRAQAWGAFFDGLASSLRRAVGVIELSKAARGPVTAMPPPRQLVRLPSRTTALGACGCRREESGGEADNGGLIRLEDDSAWRAGRVVCINECDARVRACVEKAN